MSKVTLKYTGGKAKGRKYSDGVNDCDLTDPKSCIIVVDEANAVNKLRDHGDKFEVMNGEEGILSLLETAKADEVKMNEVMGGGKADKVVEDVVEESLPVEEEIVEAEAEPVPELSWTKPKIQKWLNEKDITYETTDTKADLLELVEIVLE